MPAKPSSFEDLPVEERHTLARSAAAQRRTLMERWSAPSATMNGKWDARAATAAEWLAGEQSIADIGAGGQSLRRLLRPARYIPVDCVRLDEAVRAQAEAFREATGAIGPTDQERQLAELVWADWEAVLVVDLNNNALPLVDCAAAAALGFLEYVFDAPGLLRQFRNQFGRLVISYNVRRRASDIGSRTAIGWNNHYTLSELTALFDGTGWRVEKREPVGKRQWLFDCS